jgi:hypothetical protein
MSFVSGVKAHYVTAIGLYACQLRQLDAVPMVWAVLESEGFDTGIIRLSCPAA